MRSLFSRNTSAKTISSFQDEVALPSLTAAKVLEQIAGWHDIEVAERRELASAISTLVRVSGVPADMLPMTPERLRTDVLNKSPAAWGVKAGTHSNILSRLRKILRRLDVIDPKATELAADWAALKTLLAESPRAQMGLSCFMAFCTAMEIRPEAVTDQHLEQFEVWLNARTLNAAPRRMVTAVRRAWNLAVKQIPAWPQIELHLSTRRDQLLLPFSAFPASFNQDLAAYKTKLSGQNVAAQFGLDEDYLDDAGIEDGAEDSVAAAADGSAQADEVDTAPGGGFASFSAKPTLKPMRPLTIASKCQLIKAAATALHRSGTPLDAITSLSSLVSPLPHAAAILEQLYQANGGKTSPRLGHVAEILRQIAKYYANSPEKDVAQLSRWAQKARVAYNEMTPKNRRLVEQVLTPARYEALRLLPKALLKDAAASGPTRKGAVLCKHAAMISVLTRCPMRLGNLQNLRIDQHLLRPDPKTGQMSAIIINEDETKNRVPLTFPLNPALADLLQTWLCDYRPLLAAPGNPYVFPGKGLNPMTQPGMRDAIKIVTDERLGIAINPHAFRHIAAEAFLQKRPGDFENVKRVMGHKRLETTTRAYCRSENKTAMAIYGDILDHGFVGKLGTGKRSRRKPRQAAPALSNRRGKAA